MTRDWLLIHTKIGQEQLVFDHLQRRGHECFLPMTQESATDGGTRPSQPQPLFPRFVFIRLNNPPHPSETLDLALDLGMGPSLSFRQTFIRIDHELMSALRADNSGERPGHGNHSIPAEAANEIFTQMNGTVHTTVAAICQMPSGEERVLELLNTLSKRLKPQPDTSRASTPGGWSAPLASPFKTLLVGSSPI